jgi:hypothetical protein
MQVRLAFAPGGHSAGTSLQLSEWQQYGSICYHVEYFSTSLPEGLPWHSMTT